MREICARLLMLAAQRDTCYNKSLCGPDPFLLPIRFAKINPLTLFPGVESGELFFFSTLDPSRLHGSRKHTTSGTKDGKIGTNVSSD